MKGDTFEEYKATKYYAAYQLFRNNENSKLKFTIKKPNLNRTTSKNTKQKDLEPVLHSDIFQYLKSLFEFLLPTASSMNLCIHTQPKVVKLKNIAPSA